VESGRNGFLAPTGDEEAFLALATELVGRQNEWKAIREAARATAEAHPWSMTIDRFEFLLAGAVDDPTNGEEGL